MYECCKIVDGTSILCLGVGSPFSGVVWVAP